MQRELMGENEGQWEGAGAGGGAWVERRGTSKGLCAYIILISEARSNISNMGVLTITSITAGSMPALFQPLPLDISLNLNQ